MEKSEKEVRREIAQIEQSTTRQIDSLFNEMCLGIFRLALVKVYISRGDPLPISDTPHLIGLSEAIDSVIKSNLESMRVAIRVSVIKAYGKGEDLGLASLKDRVPENILQSLYEKGVFAHREKAAAAFVDRTTRGLALSDRVWNLKPELRTQIETVLQLAVNDGRSAIEVAGDLRLFLKEPDKLFRRVRDLSGKLQLSKAARAYHPGTGVYRSSHKNALRLARNEINIAYRKADWQQMQKLSFVIGQRIQLSSNHPVQDICDDLAGEYPKDFMWSGWHPGCRCVMTKEMISMDEFVMMQDGTFTPTQRTAYPDNFKNWIQKNTDRIKPDSGIDWIEENPEVLAMFEDLKITN